jgi:mycothiol system anti-sigma-R factor
MRALLARLFARFRGTGNGHHHAPAGGAMPPMLDCDSVMRQLWDYLDGELTVDRKAAIRTHLELCRRCHPQYEFEQSFLDAIAASGPAHSNPDRLRARLLAALEDEGLS